jgi:hypothetical protein
MINYLKDNIQEKETFDEIVNIRNALHDLEKDIIKMKEEQMRLFKLRYESYKLGTARQSIQYDLVYAALFGNQVVL